jgi:hypothetical protein
MAEMSLGTNSRNNPGDAKSLLPSVPLHPQGYFCCLFPGTFLPFYLPSHLFTYNQERYSYLKRGLRETFCLFLHIRA